MRNFLALIEKALQGDLFPEYDKEHREQRMAAWFKDAHGWDGSKPRVFYHATTKNFDSFQTSGAGTFSVLGMSHTVDRHGAFFAVDPKFAEEYIVDYERGGRFKDEAHVVPVYLSIQNPFDLRDNGMSRLLDDGQAVSWFADHDIDLWSIYRYFDEYGRWELFDGEEGEEFVRNLTRMGFDGAIMNERSDGDANGEVWVAFKPSQIKSAVGNRGSFSPDDDRLTH